MGCETTVTGKTGSRAGVEVILDLVLHQIFNANKANLHRSSHSAGCLLVIEAREIRDVLAVTHALGNQQDYFHLVMEPFPQMIPFAREICDVYWRP